MSGKRVIFEGPGWWVGAFVTVVAVQIVAANVIASVWNLGPDIPVIGANALAFLLNIAIIGVVWRWMRMEGIRFRDVGFSLELLGPAILGVGVFYLMLNLLGIGLGVLATGPSVAGYQWVVPPARAAAEFVYVLVAAAIVEELVYRGYIQSKVIAIIGDDVRVRTGIGIVTASVLFVLSHVPRVLTGGIPGQQSLTGYAGILFFSAIGYGFIYELTHNLYIPILIHAAGNMPGTIGIIFFDVGALPAWARSVYPLMYLALFAIVIVGYRRWARDNGRMPVWTDRSDTSVTS
jgi:membrane protease YdiL (CAAX protease family)